MKDLGVDYALVGGLAYGIYANSRVTDDVDFIILDESAAAVKEALKKKGFKLIMDGESRLKFKDGKTKTEVEILMGNTAPYIPAIKEPLKTKLFGQTVAVVKPEHLLWFYLGSNRAKRLAEAVELIKGGNVDVNSLRFQLDGAKDKAAIKRLKEVMGHVKREENDTWSASMIRRRNSLKRK